MLMLNCKRPQASHCRTRRRASRSRLRGGNRALLLPSWTRSTVRRTIFTDWTRIWKGNGWRGAARSRTRQALKIIATIRLATGTNLTSSIERRSRVARTRDYVYQMTIFPAVSRSACRAKENRSYLVGIPLLNLFAWKRSFKIISCQEIRVFWNCTCLIFIHLIHVRSIGRCPSE